MGILIIDDSEDSRNLLKIILSKAGFKDIVEVESAKKAIELLELRTEKFGNSRVDVIIMDYVMPEMDGVSATRLIRTIDGYKDVPILMVTAYNDLQNLKNAFEAGVTDYIRKPVDELELTARVKSSFNTKYQMDYVKDLVFDLETARKELEALAMTDGLTKIANRRCFDEFFERQWRVCRRNNSNIGIILIDIDYFKRFNDTYGHQAGDECLKQVARVIKSSIKRPGDIAARYGGEEFVVLLSETSIENTMKIAEIIRSNILSLQIPHISSDVDKCVTISLGVASVIPSNEVNYPELLQRVDKALYLSKESGRNRISS